MTAKFYKIFQTTFFLLFIPVFLFNQFGSKIEGLLQYSLIITLIFYAKPFLSLLLLYFGIYALMCKIENIPKWDGPISLIIGGLIFTLVSFGPPIVSFLLIYDSKIEPLSISKLHTIKEEALNLNESFRSRLIAAQYYYKETGAPIEYFNKHDVRLIFSPTNTDKKEHQKHIQRVQSIEKMVILSKTIVSNLIMLAVISLLIFLAFLRYRFHRSERSVQDKLE
jgi:hypothetical protein